MSNQLNHSAFLKKNMLKQLVGMTLIELTIVIILVAILSIGVYTMWGSTSFTLSGTVNVLATDIRHAQSLSISTNSRYRVNLTSTTQYQILNASGTAVTLPSNNATIMSLPTGFSMTESPNINYLVFDAKGTPYNAVNPADSGTALTAEVTITVTSDIGSTRQITITPETGRLNIL